MKQKMVYYQDMFNPDKKIYAENKVKCNKYTMRYFLTETGDMKDFCLCKHARMVNGVCTNGRCKHTKEHHNPYCDGEY